MQLKIDVDTARKLSLAELRRRARIAHIVIVRCVESRSPSGRGWHRVLEVERLGCSGNDGNVTVKDNGRGNHSGQGRTTLASRPARPATAFSALEVVALQLLFGSDPIREAFNLHRARLVDARQLPPFWRRRWNTLYATSGGR